MTVIPPIAAVNVGRSSGGGMMDSISSAIGGAGATQQTAPTTKSDGSVGLMDGIWKKALIGGAVGAGAGMILPFGGPIIGGLMGALSGAAMGAFSNWSKMNTIKKENEATLAAMGVQTQDPAIQAVLKSGNVEQLIPLAEQQLAAQQAAQVGQVGQGGVGQSVGQGYAPSTLTPIDPAAKAAVGQAPTTTTVVDPSATAQQSPAPTQASGGAYNPAVVADAGVAPVLGSGGAAGDVGRPPTPTTDSALPSTDVSAIAPVQAGITDASTGAAPAAAPVAATGTAGVASAQLSQEQLAAMIQQLQVQIDQLKQLLAQGAVATPTTAAA